MPLTDGTEFPELGGVEELDVAPPPLGATEIGGVVVDDDPEPPRHPPRAPVTANTTSKRKAAKTGRDRTDAMVRSSIEMPFVPNVNEGRQSSPRQRVRTR